MNVRLFALCLVFALLVLSGCVSTGIGSVSATNQLTPGMKPDDVKALLGDPSQTQFISDKWVWKYSLHQPWKGFIPYYLVFDSQRLVLTQWYANDTEYFQQQQLWLRAMPPAQRHVDIWIR